MGAPCNRRQSGRIRGQRKTGVRCVRAASGPGAAGSLHSTGRTPLSRRPRTGPVVPWPAACSRWKDGLAIPPSYSPVSPNGAMVRSQRIEPLCRNASRPANSGSRNVDCSEFIERGEGFSLLGNGHSRRPSSKPLIESRATCLISPASAHFAEDGPCRTSPF